MHADMLLELEERLQSLHHDLKAQLPQEEGLVIRPAVVSRAMRTKRKYAQIWARQQSGYCSALTEGKKSGRKRANSKFRNRVGRKADRLRKVCHQLFMVHKNIFHTLPPNYYRKHAKRSDLIARNLKGEDPDCCVLYTFDDLTIYPCIKSSERGVPSLPATAMTSQGMPDNHTVYQQFVLYNTH